MNELLGLSDHAQYVAALRRDVQGFERLAQHLKRLTGINLPTNEKNQSLMASRLSFILRGCNLQDYGALAALIGNGDHEATRVFVEALTTNTTQFFREAAHFDLLAQALPELSRARQARGNGELRLWCAAASTGQEPYTILMTLLEALPGLPHTAVKFLASDIDREVLGRAARGVYAEADVQGVPPVLRQKYFKLRANGDGRYFEVNAAHRRLLTFAQVNLVAKPYPFRHQFDVIFCRNVLIYFDRPLAEEVTRRLISALSPGGLLFLGHSESGLIKGDDFKAVASAVYQKTAA